MEETSALSKKNIYLKGCSFSVLRLHHIASPSGIPHRQMGWERGGGGLMGGRDLTLNMQNLFIAAFSRNLALQKYFGFRLMQLNKRRDKELHTEKKQTNKQTDKTGVHCLHRLYHR